MNLLGDAGEESSSRTCWATFQHKPNSRGSLAGGHDKTKAVAAATERSGLDRMQKGVSLRKPEVAC